MERFNGTVLDEFFRAAFRTRSYETLEDLQADLDEWLVHYNTERLHQGYRNIGRRPIDTINEYLANKCQKSGYSGSEKGNTANV